MRMQEFNDSLEEASLRNVIVYRARHFLKKSFML